MRRTAAIAASDPFVQQKLAELRSRLVRLRANVQINHRCQHVTTCSTEKQRADALRPFAHREGTQPVSLHDISLSIHDHREVVCLSRNLLRLKSVTHYLEDGFTSIVESNLHISSTVGGTLEFAWCENQVTPLQEPSQQPFGKMTQNTVTEKRRTVYSNLTEGGVEYVCARVHEACDSLNELR